MSYRTINSLLLLLVLTNYLRLEKLPRQGIRRHVL